MDALCRWKKKTMAPVQLLWDGVKKHCPDIARWAHWCLNGGSRVYYNDLVIPCTAGVQQRDPLAPASFSLGLQRRATHLEHNLLRHRGPCC